MRGAGAVDEGTAVTSGRADTRGVVTDVSEKLALEVGSEAESWKEVEAAELSVLSSWAMTNGESAKRRTVKLSTALGMAMDS